MNEKTIELMLDEYEEKHGSLDDMPFDIVDMIKCALIIGYEFSNDINEMQS